MPSWRSPSSRPASSMMRTAFFPIGGPRELGARFVDDGDVVLVDRVGGGDHLDWVLVVGAGRLRMAALCQGVALDAIDLRAAPERREAEPNAILGEAVARRRHATAH